MLIQQGKTSYIYLVIVLVVAIVIGAGVFAWQYFGVPKEESKAPEQQIVKNETADWQTYRNEQYGFEIKYPIGTKMGDIDITGGREVWMQPPFSVGETNLNDKTLHIRMVTTQFNNGVEQPANCRSDTSTSYIVVNEINFSKTDISAEFGGTQSASVAIEYCIMKGSKAFKLVSQLSYNRYGQLPKFDIEQESEVFNQMLSTFKFLK